MTSLRLLASVAMTVSDTGPTAAAVSFEPPSVADGVDCWALAGATGVLDVNSRYAYLLWCRDFAATSVVARGQTGLLGFITGFRRPADPTTLMVWQVAVDAAARGMGLAARMLDAVYDQIPDVAYLETTVTPDNEGSIALFTGFARRRGADVERIELFSGDLVGEAHEPEILFRIGPIAR